MPQQRYSISFFVLYDEDDVIARSADEPSDALTCAFQHWYGPVELAVYASPKLQMAPLPHVASNGCVW